MTDMSKYKNVSLSKETYAILEKLSKVLLPRRKIICSENDRSSIERESEKNEWQT